MHVEAALGAVRHPRLELALEVGLHLQELEPEHLRADRDRMIASTGGGGLPLHELVGFDCLLGQGPDDVLEDLALSACHSREARSSGRHVRRARRLLKRQAEIHASSSDVPKTWAVESIRSNETSWVTAPWTASRRVRSFFCSLLPSLL